MWRGSPWRINGSRQLASELVGNYLLAPGSHLCYPNPLTEGPLHVRARSSQASTVRVNIYNLEGEWVMENEGVEPDTVVENLPERLARGYDDQLDAAIGYVMKKLEEDPKTLPPKPGPPAER